jgi:hypothetical protein
MRDQFQQPESMINDNSATIVSKVWNYAHVLTNAEVGYGGAKQPNWR